MLKNIPTLGEIHGEPAMVAELDLETIAILIEDAKAMSARATAVSRLLQGEVEARLKDQIAVAFLSEGKDTGTVHVIADGYDVEINRAKKVEWDQSALAALADQIKAANDNPADYIETSLTVPERKFSAWPEFIQARFHNARTVKPGSVSIKISKAA